MNKINSYDFVIMQDFDFDNKKGIKPSKDEIDVAKWLKKNIPTKKTKFAGHNVEYFTGT